VSTPPESTAGDLVLGLADWKAFSGSDLTSPAKAAKHGALADLSLADSPTELRIHGVSGSSGPVMLEHPDSLQVGGDAKAGFYRRWSPDGGGRLAVPWRLEAYSWGPDRESDLVGVLVGPRAIDDLQRCALRADQKSRRVAAVEDRYGLSRAVLRVLALAATAQLIFSAVIALAGTVAWQDGAPGTGGPVQRGQDYASTLPTWLGFFTNLDTGSRVGLALTAVALLTAVLILLSRWTVQEYEGRRTGTEPDSTTLLLGQAGFWHGHATANRQLGLHSGVAAAVVALAGALLPSRWPALRTVELAAAGVVFVAAIAVSLTSFVDRDWLRANPPERVGQHRSVLRRLWSVEWACWTIGALGRRACRCAPGGVTAPAMAARPRPRWSAPVR
jgi:hypothetical protein